VSGDDWFERAVEDEEDDDAESGDGSSDDVGAVAADGEDGNWDDEWAQEAPGSGNGAFSDDGDGRVPDSGEVTEPAGEVAEPATGRDADSGEATDVDESDDDEGGLFDDDFASALDDVDAPGGVPGGGPGGAPGANPGATQGNGPGGDFGMGGSPGQGEAGGTGMGEGFGGDDLGEGGDFGMGGLGGGAGFDEGEEADSDVDRIDLGIDGLDAMIQGGVPARSLMVTIGSAGTGKTTFGLQFLTKGLEDGEKAVFIALEEGRESIIESATEKGMAFDEYVERGDLAIVDIDPVQMANSLKNIRSELPGLVQDFGASRVVLDSVSLLEMMYEDRARRRNEIYDFTRSLKESGVSTLLVSEASDDTPYASRYGIVEYLTDAVFVLQYVRPSDFRETRLAVEIQKIRDANHSRETKPYDITDEGIDVYRQANIF
jgi:KaiC domain protein